MGGELIYRAKQYRESDATHVNFYFETDSVAVSDNHRMAYFFFARNASPSSQLINIDTHADCSFFRSDAKKAIENAGPLSDVDSFLNTTYLDEFNESCAAVEYGNWITALLEMYPDVFEKVFLYCHKSTEMITKDLEQVFARPHFELPDLKPTATFTCFSLDLDYYFEWTNDEHRTRDTIANPNEHCTHLIKSMLSWPNHKLFIALSPSSCGGMESLIPFLEIIDRELGLSIAKEPSLWPSDSV